MSKEIYLHLGTMKTGTTFLQKKVFIHLKDVSLFVQPRFSTLFEVQYAEHNKVLISEERFSGKRFHRIPAEIRITMLNALKVMYPDAAIIITFREYKSFLRSAYAEAIKKGFYYENYKESFDVYKTVVDSNWSNYEAYKKEIKKRWDRVLILDYVDLKKDYKAYIKSICDFMGIETPDVQNRFINASKK